MTPNRGRIICHLTVLLVSLPALGCYIPGGGWTMRTGVDLRRHKKPSAFVELVDTRWDEYNRIAEINTMMALTPPPAAPVPGGGPGLMEGIPVPPASGLKFGPDSRPSSSPVADGSPESSSPPDPRFPDDLNGDDTTADEPSRLPGAPEGPADAPADRDPPTARRAPPDGLPFDNSATDNVTKDPAVAPASAKTELRPSRRPMASRLFARPQ
jgi:hypothetical protein